jgi:predicted RNase H-like HicB family nuclease
MNDYIALFEYEEDEFGFGVVFPDLPGCVSVGDTYDDAVRMAHEALSLYAEDEGSMPTPRTLEQIRAEWEDWPEWEANRKFYIGKVTLYPLKVKTKKFNISIDEGLVRRIDRITRNRSAFIVEAVERLLNTGA